MFILNTINRVPKFFWISLLRMLQFDFLTVIAGMGNINGQIMSDYRLMPRNKME